MGDGVGILLQISDDFFRKTLKKKILTPELLWRYVFSWARNKLLLNQHKKMFEVESEQARLKFIT